MQVLQDLFFCFLISFAQRVVDIDRFYFFSNLLTNPCFNSLHESCFSDPVLVIKLSACRLLQSFFRCKCYFLRRPLVRRSLVFHSVDPAHDRLGFFFPPRNWAHDRFRRQSVALPFWPLSLSGEVTECSMSWHLSKCELAMMVCE